MTSLLETRQFRQFGFSLCVVAEQYILHTVKVYEEEVNRKFRPKDTTVYNTFNRYIEPERRNTQRYRQTDR